MLQRVAVLSDIHGVLPALRAVLAEPEVRAAERIVVTGDICAGPQPGEVLDALIALGDRALMISGNADRELVEYRTGRRDSIPDPIAPWAADQLDASHITRLAELPSSATLEIAGLGMVLFCHATPRDDEEMVVVDSRLDRWEEVLAGVDRSIGTVLLGHTHMPFVRLAHGRLVVNPGSVGMPYGQAGAHWALLGPGVELRVTSFDSDSAIDAISRDSAFPDAGEWARTYLTGTITDAEALAVFAPRDGRGEP